MGWSYSQIRSKLNIAKSTLSNWFRDLPPSEHQSLEAKQLRIRNIQPLGAAANARLRQERLARVEKEALEMLSDFPKDSKPAQEGLLSMLYWAEGEKDDRRGLVLANTDPALLSLYLKLLRNCYQIDEKRLRVRVHLHYYHVASKAIQFWSDTLNIPKLQFGKIYRKKRSVSKRFRQNFQGICFVAYNDTALKNRVMFVARAIQKRYCEMSRDSL